MHWIICGFLIFGFAAPSAVVGVPFAIGTQGVVVGVALCLMYTLCTALGAFLLIELSAKYKDARELKDLGKFILGPNGAVFATIIQNGNFLLFLPVALDLVASAAQGVADPKFNICSDYFVIGMAVVCLLTTQIRSFRNAEVMSILSVASVFTIGVIILVIVSTNENEDKVDALAFGNPEGDTKVGMAKALLGVTTAVWSYVPSFLIIELREEMGLISVDPSLNNGSGIDDNCQGDYEVDASTDVMIPSSVNNNNSNSNNNNNNYYNNCDRHVTAGNMTVNLTKTKRQNQGLYRAVLLSAALNVSFYVVIGVVVVANWGWEMEDPLTIVSEWPGTGTLARAMNALLCLGNLVSYALDSVAVTRKFQEYVDPNFDALNDWSAASYIRYLGLSSCLWFFALVVSVIAPSMFVILAFVTAFTVPWVTLIFPSFCYLVDGNKSDASTVSLLAPQQYKENNSDGNVENDPNHGTLAKEGMNSGDVTSTLHSKLQESDDKQPQQQSRRSKEDTQRDTNDASGADFAPILSTTPWISGIWSVYLFTVYGREVPGDSKGKLRAVFYKQVSVGLLVLGVCTFILCALAAIGKAALPELRGPVVIGCNGWEILNE